MQPLDIISGWKYGVLRQNAGRITMATRCSKITWLGRLQVRADPAMVC